MLKVLTIDKYENILRKVSKEVSFDEPDLKQNIEDIKEWCLNNDNAYAMAAIQFGIDKRIVFIKSTTENVASQKDAQEIMINPQILSKEGCTEFWEACVSGLDNFALVERPYKIAIKYQNEKGELLIKELEGFPATVVSHELDHLEGIFHMDRAKKNIKFVYSRKSGI